MARYYSAGLSRFLSVDPGDDTDLDDPQSWNKYAYIKNNPLKFFDDTGEAVKYATHADQKAYEPTVQQLRQSPTFNAAMSGFEGSGAPIYTHDPGPPPYTFLNHLRRLFG